MPFNPLYRLCQSLFECVGGFPVCQAQDFLIAAKESVDLAFFRACPLLVTDNPRLRIDLANQFMGQISDADLPLCGDIDLFPDRPIGSGNFIKTVGSILDIIKVSRRRQGTKADFLFSGKELGNNRRDDRPRRLSRPKCVEWSHNCHRQTKAPIKTLRQSVCPDFRSRVWRLALIGMFFIDRNILGCSIHF